MNTYYLFDQLIFWVSHAACAVNLFMWVYAVATIMILRVICRGMTHKEKELRFQSAIDYATVKEFGALHETLQISFWLELILLALLWFAGMYTERTYISSMLMETGELACRMTALALAFSCLIRSCAPACAIQAKSLADGIFKCSERMVFVSLVYAVFHWVICV